MQLLNYHDKLLEKVYFNKLIEYNYENPKIGAIAVIKNLIDSIFHTDSLNTVSLKECIKRRNEFFIYCAKNLNGELFKNYLMACGERNSGKGLLSDFFKYAFACYIGSFDIENIMVTKTYKDDRKTWLFPFTQSRLVFNNEIDIDGSKLRGKELKTIGSGGDTVQIRLMATNSTEYRITGGLVSFQQELPIIDDACAYDTMLYFKFPCYFSECKSEYEYAFYRPPVKDIKNIIKVGDDDFTAIELRCAFVNYVMSFAYFTDKIELLKEKAMELKESIEEVNVEEGIKLLIKSDENGFMTTKDLLELVKNKIRIITPQKLSEILLKIYNQQPYYCKIRGPNRDKRGYKVSLINYDLEIDL
jgi:hypothetical protein